MNDNRIFLLMALQSFSIGFLFGLWRGGFIGGCFVALLNLEILTQISTLRR